MTERQQVILYGGPLDGSTNFQVPLEEDGTLPMLCTFPFPEPEVMTLFNDMLGEDVQIEFEGVQSDRLVYARGRWPRREGSLVPYIFAPMADKMRERKA